MSGPTIEERVQDLERRLLALGDSIEQRVAKLERAEAAREAAAHEPERSSGAGNGRKKSPREFLLEKAPRSMNDKVLAMGYYLEVVSGVKYLDLDNLYAALNEAKEPTPANRRDPPYQNVKKGYFREIGKREQSMNARNQWSLTNTGIARVEAGFK